MATPKLTEKQQRETRLLELVETHNLANSLRRLNNTGPYDSRRWKRALYHAFGISGVPGDYVMKKFRETLELP